MFSIDVTYHLNTVSEITDTEVQNSTFFHWRSLLDFDLTRYYNPGWLRHTGSEDTVLFCVLATCPFPLFVALCDPNPLELQTQDMDVMLMA